MDNLHQLPIYLRFCESFLISFNIFLLFKSLHYRASPVLHTFLHSFTNNCIFSHMSVPIFDHCFQLHKTQAWTSLFSISPPLFHLLRRSLKPLSLTSFLTITQKVLFVDLNVLKPSSSRCERNQYRLLRVLWDQYRQVSKSRAEINFKCFHPESSMFGLEGVSA